MNRNELLAAAREAAHHAHCPYSHFGVVASVVANGLLYTGVNIEISSYGLTLCAERAALAAALSAGAVPDTNAITHLAVTCLDAPRSAPDNERTPCGACRQWIADLAPHAILFIDGIERDMTIHDLLPYAFGLPESR